LINNFLDIWNTLCQAVITIVSFQTIEERSMAGTLKPTKNSVQKLNLHTVSVYCNIGWNMRLYCPVNLFTGQRRSMFHNFTKENSQTSTRWCYNTSNAFIICPLNYCAGVLDSLSSEQLLCKKMWKATF